MCPPFFRQGRHRRIDELELVRQQRSEGIKHILPVFGLIFLVSIAFLSSLIVLTPLFGLRRLEEERSGMQKQLVRARAEMERAHNEFRWMQDPEYFEQIARDRANLAKEGETILRPAEQGGKRSDAGPRGRQAP